MQYPRRRKYTKNFDTIHLSIDPVTDKPKPAVDDPNPPAAVQP
jgi:hypothetical protein